MPNSTTRSRSSPVLPGQGRAHATRTAEEGASIIAMDICAQVEIPQHLPRAVRGQVRVVGLMRLYSKQLAKHSIRVNTVHPTAVNTPMTANAEYGAFVDANPDVATDPSYKNLMPVELVEAVDISHAIPFLASHEARYVTGITMPVDAGYYNR